MSATKLVAAEDFKKFVSPKRKRIIAPSASKKSNIKHLSPTLDSIKFQYSRPLNDGLSSEKSLNFVDRENKKSTAHLNSQQSSPSKSDADISTFVNSSNSISSSTMPLGVRLKFTPSEQTDGWNKTNCKLGVPSSGGGSLLFDGISADESDMFSIRNLSATGQNERWNSTLSDCDDDQLDDSVERLHQSTSRSPDSVHSPVLHRYKLRHLSKHSNSSGNNSNNSSSYSVSDGDIMRSFDSVHSPPSLTSAAHCSGGGNSGDRCMAGHMSGLSVDGKCKRKSRLSSSTPSLSIDGTPPQRIKGDKHGDNALFGSDGMDLLGCTPVTERGSPAVMHGLMFDDFDGVSGVQTERQSKQRQSADDDLASRLFGQRESLMSPCGLPDDLTMVHSFDAHNNSHSLSLHKTAPQTEELHRYDKFASRHMRRESAEETESEWTRGPSGGSSLRSKVPHDAKLTHNFMRSKLDLHRHHEMTACPDTTAENESSFSDSGSVAMNTSMLSTVSSGSGGSGAMDLEEPATFSAFSRAAGNFRRRSGTKLTSGLLSQSHSNNHSNNSSSYNLSFESNASSNKPSSTDVSFRPLPDQSAFDQTLPNNSYGLSAGTFSGNSKYSAASPAAAAAMANSSVASMAGFSPQCPPTPQRVAAWSVDSMTEKELAHQQHLKQQQQNHHHTSRHMEPPPRLARQSSLVDTKVLLAQDDEDDFHPDALSHVHSDISFHRDFVSEGLLGSGTFADVYKVTQRNSTDTTHYAVKKSRRQFQSKKDREWLMNEVRTMKLLGSNPCPYIIQFVRAWQEDSFFYVQIGLAEKGTLRDLMNDLVEAGHIFPSQTLYHVLHDVSAGLLHIHECGMIHLDIKPANLLITASGVVQIGDFGMATHKGSRDDGHEGDTRYMANELLNNTERLPSADIFSLGVTLYELSFSLTKLEKGCISLPFEGPLWHDLRQGRAEPILDRPPTLAKLINAAMSPTPRDRPTAAQILAAREVAAVKGCEDETLLNAKHIITQPAVCRSNSFNPAFMSSLSITTALTHLPPDEYAALMERAITPH